MNPRRLKNIAASIRQRLLNKAREDGRPFNELLQYFAMERFLYRLSKSEHAEKFVLKGALMLRVWRSPESRPTMDIDVLGRTANDPDSIIAQVRDVISIAAATDGLVFDASSIQAERITEDADYAGIRVVFRGALDTAKFRVQMAVGFGDVVFPDVVSSELPALLDFPFPKLMGYSRESTIAEKFEAMLKLDQLNSRMKDFFDIWLLARSFDFEGEVLAEAIRLTLGQRGTELPDEIGAFSQNFIDAKRTQWTAFRRRLNEENVPEEFSKIIGVLIDFLSPVAHAVNSGTTMLSQWNAPGPWL
jgi:predicted nucleotidyltransferase component of viral defense system